MSRVAKRYAKALFKLTEKNPVEARATLASLEVLEDLFTIPDSGKVLNSPSMPMALKKEILDYGLKVGGANEGLSQVVDYLVKQRRETIIPKLVAVYRQILDSAEGVARGQVTSAVALSKDEKELISATLKNLLGKEVILDDSVERDLLGGFVAKVGHYLVDLSLKTKLDGISHHVTHSHMQSTNS